MNVCFILGSSQELSLAELFAVLTGRGLFFDVIGLGDTSVELSIKNMFNEQELMESLGGCVKIGSFLREISSNALSPTVLADLLFSLTDKRTIYGLSVSSVSDMPKNKRMNPARLKRLGIAVKRELKQRGRQSRCVISQDSSLTLSSVVVEKNGLLKEGGVELLLIESPKTIHIYQTHAVQPFEAFSHRDFGRPSRSMSIGMLPPKIARMMVNISKAPVIPHSSLLDPFCGTGTILQEALLLGVDNCFGTDISDTALTSTQKNLEWLKKTFPVNTKTSIAIRKCDAQQLRAIFSSSSINAIVTETYLGPIVKKNASIDRRILVDLEKLYYSSFQSFAHILTNGARVVIAWPFWPSRNSALFLPTLLESLKESGFKNITRSLLSPFNLPSSQRNSILWYREGQQVGREICVFEFTQT